MDSESPLMTHLRAGPRLGYNPITEETNKSFPLDFGIHTLLEGESIEYISEKESAWILMDGRALIQWENQSQLVERTSLFEDDPTCLVLSQNSTLKIKALGPKTEWAVVATKNSRKVTSRFFSPQEVRPEQRGKGLAQGACERNVRLIFDKTIKEDSNLVVGEVVNYPGKWSSYPPHHHSQPELYHYRFTEPQGYGHSEVGDEVFKVKNYDTVKINGGLDHAQAAAPGYGMYYLWVVKHIEGNPYLGFQFSDEHKWILNPENQGWEPRS